MMATEVEEWCKNFMYVVGKLKGGIWENGKFW
jgi:hypothetical protein